MAERQFAFSGAWALGADSLQWILYRRYRSNGKDSWRAISFVSSTRDILARCMREDGCGLHTERLLVGLPSTFDQWRKSLQIIAPAAPAPLLTVGVDGHL